RTIELRLQVRLRIEREDTRGDGASGEEARRCPANPDVARTRGRAVLGRLTDDDRLPGLQRRDLEQGQLDGSLVAAGERERHRPRLVTVLRGGDAVIAGVDQRVLDGCGTEGGVIEGD